MFEASFRIVALAESDGQGQRVFRITRREAPTSETEFLSLLMRIYQQEMEKTLQGGDSLTITFRLDLPPRELERTVRMREDRRFEGEGVPQPTSDLLPLMQELYEPLVRQVAPGDVFTITFLVQRL